MDSNQNTKDNRDDHVDDEIIQCLDLKNPKSFFLFAGAGSGKTRSLVKALKTLKGTIGNDILIKNQQIAVITYTNAACDEILRRIDYNPLFAISTIHSFAWELIKPYHQDIKEWLIKESIEKISDLQSKQTTGRTGTKAYIDRQKEIERHNKRLKEIEYIKKFIYNPNGENIGKGSLNHTEVIKMSAYFIEFKLVMQNVLINKFPIFLIDESQDTKTELIDALMKVQQNRSSSFVLGLFGDTMQRIYLDGKERLNEIIPAGWEKPYKVMNHRSQKRIVDLINDIRVDVDKQKQQPREDKMGGIVHFFICENAVDKDAVEKEAMKQMAHAANDPSWNNYIDCKILTLEHHMASKRLGFDNYFGPLYRVDSYKTGLLDGSLSGTSFFIKLILPLVQAYKESNNFNIAKIIRSNSPIFKDGIKNKNISVNEIQLAKQYADELFKLWTEDEPTCLEILQCISKNKLFDIPPDLYAIASRNVQEQNIVDQHPIPQIQENDDAEEDKDILKINAWDNALKAKFSEVERYYQYISGKANFDTHQGVKGLQFPRVMVIIDDEEARGFLFSYNKLFGVSVKSETDIRNEQQGRETTIDRTKRLFYVACSRAQESLAIMYYTPSAEEAKTQILKSGWFSKNEITILKNKNLYSDEIQNS